MKTRRYSLIFASLLLLTGTGSAMAATARTPEDAARQYLQAEAAFDLDTLKAVLDPQFIEISPRGQVDEHDAVLSFYAPEKKIAAPQLQIEPFKVRTLGNTALLTTQISYRIAGGGLAKRMLVGIVAKQTAQGWVLLSAQYTPILPDMHPQSH